MTGDIEQTALRMQQSASNDHRGLASNQAAMAFRLPGQDSNLQPTG